ncbi:chromate transporter [Hominifimenecus sp. rT4P-3]|uniref:chromate transporter n=1 Tax=Hominifimenecus sp. rT4P-3 TaxID=3242979 RepID=UPI003DA3E451
MVYLNLFFAFVRIGFCSFGGLSMIPVINQEMLQNGWMTLEEVADIVAIAEMTPGPLGVNCATFAGMRTAGILGALCATFGVLVPSLTLCLLAAVFIQKVKGSPLMEHVMYGVRPVCIGMVLYVLFTLCGSNFFPESTLESFSLKPVLIAGIVGVVSWKKKAGVPVLIVIAAVLGLILI